MNTMPDPRRFHSQLKEVARVYTQANERYTQAMHRGDLDRADDALSRMLELERNITVIVPAGVLDAEPRKARGRG